MDISGHKTCKHRDCPLNSARTCLQGAAISYNSNALIKHSPDIQHWNRRPAFRVQAPSTTSSSNTTPAMHGIEGTMNAATAATAHQENDPARPNPDRCARQSSIVSNPLFPKSDVHLAPVWATNVVPIGIVLTILSLHIHRARVDSIADPLEASAMAQPTLEVPIPEDPTTTTMVTTTTTIATTTATTIAATVFSNAVVLRLPPPRDPLATLIKAASIIVWDEAPMIYRHAFETVDRCLRDIMKSVDIHLRSVPFGGKVVVFGGDFRQIAPVVKKRRSGRDRQCLPQEILSLATNPCIETDTEHAVTQERITNQH
ncbi:PIF1-like helicase-domain-containing protein [Mortierella sp. GBAus27b]|nr:PIF1-like helicase-domain-containing protein [Mortierella sp. GBAus27b]